MINYLMIFNTDAYKISQDCLKVLMQTNFTLQNFIALLTKYGLALFVRIIPIRKLVTL